MAQEIIFQWKVFSADITQKSFREVDKLVSNSYVIVEAVLARQKFIAIGTVEADQLLLEDFLAFNLRLGLVALVFFLHLSEMIALDVPVEIIFHFEKSFAVRALEHITFI